MGHTSYTGTLGIGKIVKLLGGPPSYTGTLQTAVYGSVSTRATAGRLERSHAVVQTGEKREERDSGAHILHWDIGNW